MIFARAIFLVVVVLAGVLGFLGGMGRGPGLMIAVIVLGGYALVRGRRLPRNAYFLLTAGIVAVAGMWLVVPLLRS